MVIHLITLFCVFLDVHALFKNDMVLDVIKTYPFDIDDTTRTTLPTLEPVLAPIIDIAPEVLPVNSPTTHAQSSPEVVVPLSYVQPSHNRKFTQLPNFVYSFYYGSFAAFIASIHHLHGHSSYKEVVCVPL